MHQGGAHAMPRDALQAPAWDGGCCAAGCTVSHRASSSRVTSCQDQRIRSTATRSPGVKPPPLAASCTTASSWANC